MMSDYNENDIGRRSDDGFKSLVQPVAADDSFRDDRRSTVVNYFRYYHNNLSNRFLHATAAV